ncbi:YcaO-like family protein [Curtobacterium sp. ISL-83]|uniref:YcaO-like family protein n=1 Tax=Curtobacterium sp. ISL-83 TaxID=2819145 RepID=UPI001BE5EEDC|nr:YcaO-like family protein [Curtobacterium sp. ISL-83]MBT2501868.1 YcaO-like family protein [Curtobacterium sp. ISL-83]
MIAAESAPRCTWAGARDFTGETIELPGGSSIEVRDLDRLDRPGVLAVPNSLVKAPYLPPTTASVVAPTSSSTTGAATGGNVAEASLQAILEIVERDAFWFAARTGLPLAPAHAAPTSADIASVEETYGVQVVLTWLPNPLALPVAHCVLVAGGDGHPACSRGMGVSISPDEALRKSLIEAVQMWRSLATGLDVGDSDTDMRALWWTGQAQNAFPGLFGATAASTDRDQFWGKDLSGSPADTILDELVRHAARNGLHLSRAVLADNRAHAVVRCIAEEVLPLDDLSFPNQRRFDAWRAFTGFHGPVSYRRSLFM